MADWIQFRAEESGIMAKIAGAGAGGFNWGRTFHFGFLLKNQQRPPQHAVEEQCAILPCLPGVSARPGAAPTMWLVFDGVTGNSVTSMSR